MISARAQGTGGTTAPINLLTGPRAPETNWLAALSAMPRAGALTRARLARC